MSWFSGLLGMFSDDTVTVYGSFHDYDHSKPKEVPRAL